MNSNRTDSAPAPGGTGPRLFRAQLRRGLAIATLLGADLLVGWVVSALGFVPRFAGVPLAVAGLSSALLSPGFALAAVLEIALLASFFGTIRERLLGPMLAAQAGLLMLSPGTFIPRAWTGASLLAGAVLMTGVFILILQSIYRNKQLAPTVSDYVVRWGLVATTTAAGWAVWAIDSTSALVVLSVPLQLAVALGAALRGRPSPQEDRIPWLLRPFWTFRVLLFTFLAEFFLGALLDYEIAGPGFLQYIPFLPMPSGGIAAGGVATYDGLWFAAAILASAWFLVVLGFTMGTLVVLRIRETHEPAQRYRMGLMVGVFALAAVFVPSFASSTPLISSQALATLPVVGWGFGLRAGGPFESSIFLAVLVMYASVGALTVLFGRKALCSVMCGAALMYQASTINEMRRFNQTSRIGRYFLGSQLSTAYTVASSLALVSLFGVSLLGALHMLPAVQVANGKLDTAALPLPIELYFGGLWFVMFVATPYVGTYSCATTGFCHWGALSLPFARIGLFRLKVKDKKVCQACTTFDCAKACPVGLVDMPEHFRTTGEYRSSKCCGVGDCVGACPYGNLYHQDVRFWIRRMLRRSRSPKPGTTLPMLPTGRSGTAVHASTSIPARE